MRFLLYVEGKTEYKALGGFLKKWLDERLNNSVRVEGVRFNGYGDYLSGVTDRAPRDLDKPNSDVIAVIGLLDIYELQLPFPKTTTSMAERLEWANQHITNQVNHPNFRQFFAVHETEAWLLSDDSIFPSELRGGLSGKTDKPEGVNFQEPPGKLLERLYRTKTGKAYSKAVHGPALFSSLNPETAYQKCPNLKAMLDEMLRLAQEAGL